MWKAGFERQEQTEIELPIAFLQTLRAGKFELVPKAFFLDSLRTPLAHDAQSTRWEIRAITIRLSWYSKTRGTTVQFYVNLPSTTAVSSRFIPGSEAWVNIRLLMRFRGKGLRDLHSISWATSRWQEWEHTWRNSEHGWACDSELKSESNPGFWWDSPRESHYECNQSCKVYWK